MQQFIAKQGPHVMGVLNLNSAVGSLGIRQRVDRVDGMDEVDGNGTHPAGRAQGFRALGERRSLRNLLSF